METAIIVKVAVNAAPYSIDKPYDYLVPEPLLETAVLGVRVSVPFGRGNRHSEGVILVRTTGGKSKGLKPLLAVLDQEPVLDKDGIALALWMRQRYFCTLFEAIKAILPAGLWYRFREIWRIADLEMTRTEADRLSASVHNAQQVLDALYAADGKMDFEQLKLACGEKVGITLRTLQKLGVLICETEAKRKISDKKRYMVEMLLYTSR